MKASTPNPKNFSKTSVFYKVFLRIHSVVLAGLIFSAIFSQTVQAKYQIAPTQNESNNNENRALLQRISKAVTDIASESSKALVYVSIVKTVRGNQGINPFEFFFGPGGPQFPQMPEERTQSGIGSGFFIDLEKGYILTNNHVVEGADEIQIKTIDGKTYDAKVIGTDKNTDVAVVQVKNKNFDRKNLAALNLGDSDKLAVGDFVVAVGAPFGLEASLSFGIISALGRGSLGITALGNFIQTDAAINPGNSGGPLLNTFGQVAGINTAIFSRSGAYNGIGFAIPANLARTVAEQLINEGKINRGYIGVNLHRDSDPSLFKDLGLPNDLTGALLSGVAEGGPAAKAGLEAGDVVTAVGGKKITNDSELVSTIGLMKPGTSTSLSYYRNGKERSTNIVIAEYPNEETLSKSMNPKNSIFGLQLTTLNDALRTQFNIRSRTGVVVTDVQANSIGYRAGLERGDCIIQVGSQKVKTPSEVQSLTSKSKRVLLRVERAGQMMFIPMQSNH